MSNKKKVISFKACLALLFYLIIPSFAIITIIGSYPELPKDRFFNMIRWILPTSIVLVFLAQCNLFSKKGKFGYYVCNIGFVITTMIWVYGILGGSLIITTQWNEFNFSINMYKYVILIVTVACINILYYTLEWRFYNKQSQKSVYKDKKPIATPSNSTISA